MHLFAEWMPGGQQAMLRGIWELLDAADAMVTFNGDRADNKWLASEFVLAGMNAPSPARSIDLCKVIRRRFAFLSNSLAYSAAELGVRNKTDSGGLQTIVAAMSGDADAQARLSEYCVNDVRVTEELFTRIKSFIPGLPVVPLVDVLGGLRCPACGSDGLMPRGWYYSRTGRYRRWVCECGKWVRSVKRDAAVEITEIAA